MSARMRSTARAIVVGWLLASATVCGATEPAAERHGVMLRLKDGTTAVGDSVGTHDGALLLYVDGHTVEYRASDVETIEAWTPPARLEAELTSESLAPKGTFDPDRLVLYRLQAANDTVFHTDDFYTHGTRMSFVYGRDRGGECARNVGDWLLGRLGPGWQQGRSHAGIAIGQLLYTPTVITTAGLLANDRPYAGWLYVGPILGVWNDTDQVTIEADVGITGPWSFAKESQTIVHRNTHNHLPQGWKHQIATEPGLDASLRWDHVLLVLPDPHRDPGAVRWLDLGSFVEPHVGNIFTFLRGGVTARVGFMHGTGFGGGVALPPTTSVPMLASNANVRLPERSPFPVEIFGFGRVAERFVVRNEFIQGTVFTQSEHTMKAEPFVMEGDAGIALTVWRFHATVGAVFRTREISAAAPPDPLGHKYGELQAGWDF